MSSDGGKGSGRRPSSVSDDVVADNWSQIFSKSKLQQRLERERALDELVRISEELGLYEDYDKVTRYNTETQEVKR
jgi:hypothetical protein